MRYCFDLDDTICVHRNRDYENARPVEAVIARMQEIRKADPEAWIIIYTSRGMNSCKGDAMLADQTNRPTMEAWLKKHDVPYDQIIFGKPLADVYIDDKAMRPGTFTTGGVQAYEGFSGAKVVRIGDVIVKDCGNAIAQADWYARDRMAGFKHHKTPDVAGTTLTKIFMSYVPGEKLYGPRMDIGATLRVHGIIREFQEGRTEGENDLRDYCDTLSYRADICGMDISGLRKEVESMTIAKRRTFCHGDMTQQNIIVGEGRQYYLIDPSPKAASTWVLDAAKFRASLNGLDNAITGKNFDTGELVKVWDEYFTPQEQEEIRVFERTHFIRVMYYARTLNREDVFERLKAIYNRL